MNIVICPKTTGNTRKACEAIAALDGWSVSGVEEARGLDLSAYDRVILATGVYGGAPHRGILGLVEGLDGGRKPARVAVLLTWLGRGKSDRAAFNHIKKACAAKGVAVLDEYKRVLGQSFGVLRIGHPTQGELDGCAAWARGLPAR